MIVADTNLIVYLLMEGPMLPTAEAVFRRDPEWLAPPLWRSELRNVLAGLVRRGQLDVEGAVAYWEEADSLVVSAEEERPAEILRLAATSGCTAYDCEYVALARHLDIPLVTADRQVLAAFPDIAASPQAFLEK